MCAERFRPYNECYYNHGHQTCWTPPTCEVEYSDVIPEMNNKGLIDWLMVYGRQQAAAEALMSALVALLRNLWISF